MKRILSLILALTASVLLSSCKIETGFAFRGHHFGDTMEQVQKLEGSDGAIVEEEFYGNQMVSFSPVKFAYWEGISNYLFKDNELKHICFFSTTDIERKTEDVFEIAKEILCSQYGNPDQEDKEFRDMYRVIYKALWRKNEYGIVLIVSSRNNVVIAFSSDSEKSDKYYYTYRFKELLGD